MSENKSFFQSVSEKHESLKKRIHNFRIPLSPAGRRIMSVIYFSIPVVAGYYIMQAAERKAIENLGDMNKRHSGRKTETRQQNAALQAILDRAKEDGSASSS